MFNKNDHTLIPLLGRSTPFMNDIAVFKDGVIKLLKGLNTAAGVVPCGGRKTSPRTSTIVQFIFYFGPLRSVKIF